MSPPVLQSASAAHWGGPQTLAVQVKLVGYLVLGQLGWLGAQQSAGVAQPRTQ